MCEESNLLHKSIHIDLHTDHRCTHEENRVKVCAVCGQKMVFGTNFRSKFAISTNLCTLIKKHVNEGFDLLNDKFPTSICSSCRFTITEHEKNNKKRPLPNMPNYEDINVGKETICNCYICLTARKEAHSKITKGRGQKRKFTIKIDANNGIDGTLQNMQLPKSEEKKIEPRTSDICNFCFQKIGRGIKHDCKGTSSSSARNNVLDIVERLPEKQQNQIITTLLNKRRSESNLKDGEVILNTSGSKARVVVNKKPEKKITFTNEGLDNYQATTGSSNKHMKTMTNFIRSFAGRKSVPKNFKGHMEEKSHVLDSVYKKGIFKFETTKDKNDVLEDRPVVYANATELLETIFEKRGITSMENVRIKAMADGGQGFFKISLAVLTEDSCTPNEDEKSRTLYSAGGSISKKRKLNSVYRLILLCTVPKIKETYHNVKILFELTKLIEIPFKFTADFKLLLIVLGQ